MNDFNLKPISELKKNDAGIIAGYKNQNVYLKLLILSSFINTKFVVKKNCPITKIIIISFLGNDVAIGKYEADNILVK